MRKKYKRIFTIVLDSLGVGAMDDAASYGDEGVDTLGHIAEHIVMEIPHLRKMGIGNLRPLSGIEPVAEPMAKCAVLKEKSMGKDTMTGHWEMSGPHGRAHRSIPGRCAFRSRPARRSV